MMLLKWGVRFFAGKARFRCVFNTCFIFFGGMLLFPALSSAAGVTFPHIFSLAQNFNQNLNLVRVELGTPKAGMDPFFVANASPRTVRHQKEVTSSDDFTLTEDFARNLELVRMELGMPKSQYRLSHVIAASSREVLYQAATLCEKSSHLRFEWTRTLGECPALKFGVIQPSDVFKELRAAMDNIHRVQRHFNITGSSVVVAVDSTKTPTDVFMAIVASNRQLNVLLRKRYLPDDVFQEVTLAIYYGAELLRHFPAVEQRIPSEPVFIPRKTPKDVYMLLMREFAVIRQIAKLSGDHILDFKLNTKALSHVTPSDVYDVASVIVSELAFLHWQAGGKHLLKSYQPPPKIPAQVFQRAGILLPQLQMLLRQIKQHPDWLKRKP